MQIVVRLLGRLSQGEPDVRRFAVATPQGEDVVGYEKVWNRLRRDMPVEGLEYKLTGAGLITLIADDDQLDDETVASIRAFAEKVLAEI